MSRKSVSSTSPPPNMTRPSPPLHSFSSPSPAGPISSSSSSSSPKLVSSTNSLPPWNFPFGPSTKYHNREKSRPRHARYQSAYTPRGPVLSTEKRAHRRAAHSSVSIPRYSPTSPSSRSSPLSRFPSYNSTKMSAAKMSINPATPAKHLYRRSSDFQDSPFSDYFSEDGRSVYMTCASDETKQLLVRMNRLQSQLMRDQSSDRQKAIAIVARKLGEMEEELSKLSNNATSNLDDSAVFIDEPVEERKSTPEPAVSSTPSTPSRKSSATGRTHASKPSMNDSVMDATQTFTYEQIKAERDSLAVRLQGLSEGLNTVQGELTQRYAEVRKLNNLHNEDRERYEQHVEKLQSENEGLRSDLGFEYSELLYLKLQMKSLEVDIDNIPDEDVDPRHATIADLRRARAKRVRRNRILSEMDRWRTDWQDVSTRFKRRRNRYGVPASPLVEFEGHDLAAEWHLETVREARGHALSLTIKRIEGPPVRELSALREELIDADALRLAEAKVFKGYIDQGAQTEMSAADYMHDNFDEAETNSFFDHEYPALDELEDIECDDAFHSKRDFATRTVEDDEAEEEEDDEEESEEEEEDIHHPPKEPTGSAPPPPTPTTLPPNSSRSAWQELWASLASLSGLPDDDEDDF